MAPRKMEQQYRQTKKSGSSQIMHRSEGYTSNALEWLETKEWEEHLKIQGYEKRKLEKIGMVPLWEGAMSWGVWLTQHLRLQNKQEGKQKETKKMKKVINNKRKCRVKRQTVNKFCIQYKSKTQLYVTLTQHCKSTVLE